MLTPLLVVLLVPLLAGCVPGSARSVGTPTAGTPFTLTALDVGQPTFAFCVRCQDTEIVEVSGPCSLPPGYSRASSG